MKKSVKLLSVLFVLLLAVVVLPVTGFADEQTVQAAPVAPRRYAATTDNFADYVDENALMAYLKAQMQTCATEIDITTYGVPADGEYLSQIGSYIINNMAELFHFEWFGPYYTGNGVITKISVDYSDFADTVGEYNACIQEFNKVANRLLDGIKGNTHLTDVEKALLLHDRLVVWTEYDYANYLANQIPDISYTAYGILVNQTGVCQGYALAYDYLLEQVGIRCEYVSSDLLNHAWNIVYINNKPYHVDTTWDDPTWDVTGQVLHENFLRSSSGIKATGHEVNGQVDYITTPTDTKYDSYYWQNSETAFQLVDGWIYFIDNASKSMKYLNNGTPTTLFSIDSTWYATGNRYWTDNYSKLSSDSTTLLFSKADGIYRYNPNSGAVDKIYSPNLSVGDTFSVFGFKYEGGYLICDLSNTPDSSQPTKHHQVKQFYDKEVPDVNVSITLAPATTQTLYFDMTDNNQVAGYYFGTNPTYSGNAYTTVNGTKAERVISSSGTYYLWVVDASGNKSERFTITVYKINFDANGGSVSPSYTLAAYGTTITLPTPTRAGYTFKGWSTSKTATSGQTTLTPVANATYYAVWEKVNLNGWQRIDGNWYYYSDGVAKTGWFKEGKLWYYFDASGVMQTGWKKIGNVWYYFKSGGNMATGWAKVGNVYYYFNSSGAMQTGWLQEGKNWYYLQSSGAMATGVVKVGGTYYRFDNNGVWKPGALSGWVSIGGKWYYISGSNMAVGWKKIGGAWYYFNSSGVMQTGWMQNGSKMCYLKSSGAMAVGWCKIAGDYYYFDASGYMKTGWVNAGGYWYFMDSDGTMATGWWEIGEENYYYFRTDGSMVTGWYKDGWGDYYYFGSDGRQQFGWQTIGGKTYFFEWDYGTMCTNTWVYHDEYDPIKWYFCGADGVMVSNRWLKIDGFNYYFDASGLCTNYYDNYYN